MSFVRSEPNRRPSFQPSEPMVRASQSRPARSPSLARVVRNNGDEAAPQSRPADWSWTPAFAGVTRGDIRGKGVARATYSNYTTRSWDCAPIDGPAKGRRLSAFARRAGGHGARSYDELTDPGRCAILLQAVRCGLRDCFIYFRHLRADTLVRPYGEHTQ